MKFSLPGTQQIKHFLLLKYDLQRTQKEDVQANT